jgi:hypothetical protein
MAQQPALYSTIPFVGFHKVHQLEILERVGIRHTTFGPLVDVHKGWVGGRLEPLFLTNCWRLNFSLAVANSPGPLRIGSKGMV